MVLKYDFLLNFVFRSNSRDWALFASYSATGRIQPILEMNNSHTLPFQKRSIHRRLHLDLLDLLLKYRY